MDRLTALTEARKDAIRRAAVSLALTMWDRIVRSPDDEARFLNAWGPQALSAPIAVTSLVDGYIDAAAQARGIKPPPRLNIPDVLDQLRVGVDRDEVNRRPFKHARIALSKGADFDPAMQQARQRLQSIVVTDVQQAQRVAFRDKADKVDQIVGYERTLKGDSCVLCIAASTKRYRKSRLADMHPGCNCGIDPIWESDGRNIRRGQLTDRLPEYDDAIETLRANGINTLDGSTLRNLRIDEDRQVVPIREVQHSELGPLLGNANHAAREL